MSQGKSKTKNNLIMQGSILAIASIVVRLIGFLYRIPLVNIIGDSGMGYYGTAFDIYSYLLIISSYGFPAAISKIVSGKLAQKKYKEAHNIFKSALLLCTIIGIISSTLLWFGSNIILDGNIIHPKSIYAIKSLAPTLLIFSIMAVFRGYFQGMNTMVPTAISQVFEQIFNAIFSIVLALFLVGKGIEYGACGGTMGTGIGAFFGLVILIVIYLMARKVIISKVEKDNKSKGHKRIFSYWKLILMTSVPIVIGSAVYQAASLVDLFMVQNALFLKGYNYDKIISMYGILTGKYRIIITLPVSIASALAVASIPSITRSVIKNNFDEARNKIELALRTILLISLPSFVGVFVLAKPILFLLFGNTNLEIASLLLKIGSISIIFFGISTISIGILQGLGHFKVPVINSIFSVLIKISFNFILIYVFDTNLYGAVITNILFALSAAILNVRAINKHIKIGVNFKKTIIVPSISSIVMGISVLSMYKLIYMLGGINSIALLSAIIIGMLVYFVLLFKLHGLSKEELLSFPKGYKVVNILEKLRLV
jgi:stage V sporulation protein B